MNEETRRREDEGERGCAKEVIRLEGKLVSKERSSFEIRAFRSFAPFVFSAHILFREFGRGSEEEKERPIISPIGVRKGIW